MCVALLKYINDFALICGPETREAVRRISNYSLVDLSQLLQGKPRSVSRPGTKTPSHCSSF